MEGELEAYRLAAIERLHHEASARAEKKRKMTRQLAALEDEMVPAAQAMSRAQIPLPERSCPRCWIWDGELVELTAQDGTDKVDRYSCKKCAEEFEVPLD